MNIFGVSLLAVPKKRPYETVSLGIQEESSPSI